MFTALLSASTAQEKKPNFIIIFTDDQGYQDLGCYGSPTIKTPHIDQMAKEGMRFTSFYAQTVCGPSRAALMTGCYPQRVARNDSDKDLHPKLALSEITIAEILKKKGYATAMYGKWDLAGHTQVKFNPKLGPLQQGFDTAFWTPSSNDHKINHYRDNKLVKINDNMALATKKYTDEAIGFILEKKSQPFFIYLAHIMPHIRLDATEQFKGKSQGGLYGDTVEEIDFNVGRILETLKKTGLDENTYVIFTSDNGPWWIAREHGGSALPLRGAKCSTFEGGLRVPFIIRAPGKVPAGLTCDSVAASIDLLPTIAALSGNQAPSDRTIDGIDISPLFHGTKKTIEREFFYYAFTLLRAVRKGKWKLHIPNIPTDNNYFSKIFKDMVAKGDSGWTDKYLLYDLDTDISEKTNLAEKHPEIVKELKKYIEWIREDLGDSSKRGKNARPVGTEKYLGPKVDQKEHKELY